MLDRSPEIGYINEPFNPTHQRGVCACVFPYWYYYLDDENARAYEPALRSMLAFRYDLVAQLRQRPSRSSLEAMARDAWHFALARYRQARPLVKDPIAVFSADRFSRMFGGDVVFLVRHPAAFAASVKRLGWTYPFDDLLAQEPLMREQLSDFEDEMRVVARRRDPIDHAALMWRLVYTVARRLRATHPDWAFVRHEDLARDPSERFADLFRRLRIRYTDNVDRMVRWYSSGPVEGESSAAEQDIRRNSVGTTRRWRELLTSEERSRIRSRCEPLAAAFYPDAGW
jgi:hypothetical protein